jgi:hypothetical protein
MASEDSNNFLYLGKHKDGSLGYVGIGGVTRPYGGHNKEADEVLRRGEVWVTTSPFSSRKDAEMAESLLIRALTWATEQQPRLTNIAKVNASKYVTPALPYKEGLLKYSEVTNTLFVKVRPGQLKGRTAPHGESGDLDLTIRCNRWWGLGKAVDKKADIKYLVAITSAVKPPRVIGVWKTHPTSDWWLEDQSNPHTLQNRTEDWNSSAPLYEDVRANGWVATVESTNPNVNDWQGLEFDWEGYNPQRLGYSVDIRKFMGLLK